jgi:hypothetical protein
MAHRASPPQVAIAWVLSRGENVIPIPGMKRRGFLDENVVAVDINLAPIETGPARRSPTARCGGERVVYAGGRPLSGRLTKDESAS